VKSSTVSGMGRPLEVDVKPYRLICNTYSVYSVSDPMYDYTRIYLFC